MRPHTFSLLHMMSHSPNYVIWCAITTCCVISMVTLQSLLFISGPNVLNFLYYIQETIQTAPETVYMEHKVVGVHYTLCKLLLLNVHFFLYHLSVVGSQRQQV